VTPAPAAAAHGSNRLLHVIYISAAVTCAFAGLAVGATLAPRRAPDPVPATAPPLLRVVGEPDVTVTVDGRAVGPEPLRLVAQKPARVRVTRAGRPSAEFDITLDWNQIRLLDVRAASPGAPRTSAAGAKEPAK
jgi:hypothetical protein